MRRFFRIFPLYLLFLLLVTLICLFVYPVTNFKGLFLSYAYLYNFIPKAWYSTQLGHTWSLAVEEHFYLLWPLLFSLFYRTEARNLALGSAIFISISFVANLVLVRNEWVNSTFFVDRWSFISGANILMGCVAALLLCGRCGSNKARRISQTNAFLIAGSVLWSNTLLLGAGSEPLSYFLRGVGFSFIVSWMFLNQESILVSFLELAPLRFCGVISYGLYMYQGFFLSTGPERNPGQSWPPSPGTGFILLCLVAPLSYYLFEKPLLKIGMRYRQAVEEDAQLDENARGALPEKTAAEVV